MMFNTLSCKCDRRLKISHGESVPEQTFTLADVRVLPTSFQKRGAVAQTLKIDKRLLARCAWPFLLAPIARNAKHDSLWFTMTYRAVTVTF